MKHGNPACYECPKGGENALHHWGFNTNNIATCLRCSLELDEENSLDLKQSNDRSRRELAKIGM